MAKDSIYDCCLRKIRNEGVPENNYQSENEQLHFIINGVVVTVSGRAKNVRIGQDSMEVNF